MRKANLPDDVKMLIDINMVTTSKHIQLWF